VKKNDQMNPECLEPTFKSGQSLTSIWGAFYGTSKIPIFLLESGGTKAVNYINQVYKGRLVDTLASIDPHRQLLLMEDNAPSHTAKVTKAFRVQNNIRKLEDWPPQSPDLNPIKNLWKIIKTNIQTNYQPKSIPEMKEAIQQAWDNIPAQTLRNLLRSMPSRMEAVIKANGGPINY
jgi:transposase